ncbi:ABC transporter ATP-binding protein [Lacticaseibacillus rhamnosus]|uniref:ABC transporter ATP-binding protein n=1 Tax=Lacticaseibacillus rhamnosus TaxID=47715 RepID=UPI0007DE9458|nr:ABC transporter ATP-binding protein [Lacticaseibacillus rhamnosus]MCT3192405.1 ABC transporter ATP-binding protein [Lacticaseibacillus rhamnosus]MCT3371156.1 ABC transporter ATP-binding protein [Lacticaseibacillus rhamnosus]OAU10945.1 multidrug ABC transporter permease [Lacticaseibacillus rhamnosus]OAU20775.1 multidrug ABC transporter permease [Lacticaseibacillus rhamnosus]OAU24976.1 multidrug ABC transporter permease [Lacticaseibacillus rhamnosus]
MATSNHSEPKPSKQTAHRALRVVRIIHQLDKLAIPVEFLRALTTVGIPYLNIAFLGLVLNQLQQHATFRQVILLIGGFLLARYLLQLASNWFAKLAEDHETGVNRRLDRATTEKLLTVSYTTLQDPDMRNQYAGAVEGKTFSGGITSLMKDGLQDFFSLVIAIGFAVATLINLTQATNHAATWLNDARYPLLIIALLLFPIIVGSWSVHHSNQIQQQLIREILPSNRRFTYFSNFTQNMDNHQVIRLYQASALVMKNERDSMYHFMNQLRLGYWEIAKFGHWPNVAIALSVIGLYILVGAKALMGVLAIGSVMIAVGYFQQLMTVAYQFLQQVAMYVNMIDYLQFYVDFLNLPDHDQSGTLPVEKRNDNEFAIQFHDVSFKYPGSDQWALRHVNLTLNIGERLALVGRNGSGKTTLIKLLVRLFKPTEGIITLNDIDIQKYDENEYRSLLGVVFQDFRLFAYSIAENVAATAHPDRERVWKALKVADVADRVKRMPKTIDTPITTALSDDGVTVSGGEAQKIAIARAWYKDAPIMILDEPTAALDPISEYEIYQRFDELIEGKTAIYVSHRMSSTRFSQRIVVLDHGKIVQDGTHNSLVAEPGIYRDLFNAQAQYYTEDRIKAARKKVATTTTAVAD